MSCHFNDWRELGLTYIVDAIYSEAKRHGGICEVYMRRRVLRIEAPGTFDVRRNDYTGDFRARDPRHEIERRIVGAMLVAVKE